MMRSALLLSLLLAAACTTTGAPPPATVAATTTRNLSAIQVANTLPQEINGFQRQGPARVAAGGAAISYAANEGSRVNVFIYEAQQSVPDGADNPLVFHEVNNLPVAFNVMIQRGIYRSATPDVGMDVTDSNKRVVGKCATFKIVQADGMPTGDALCATVHLGRVVKARVTFSQPPEPVGAGIVAVGFLSSVRDSLSKSAGAPQS